MLRLARVTHSLGLAVAATALVAAGPSTSLGQSPEPQTQEPPRPAAPSPADEDGSRDRRREPPGTIFGSLSLFDAWLTDTTKPVFVAKPGLSGVEMTCIGCRGFETTAVRPESASANAPWALQGKWRRQTTFGVLSTGFVGVRNYASPLATVLPLGRDLDPVALSTSATSMDSAVSQWSLTAGVEKTLVTRANGASVGVTADVLIPFEVDTISVDPRTSALKSPTVRVGIVLGW